MYPDSSAARDFTQVERHFSRFLFYNGDWRIASGNSIKPGRRDWKVSRTFRPFDNARSNIGIAFHCTRCGLMTDALPAHVSNLQIASISNRENLAATEIFAKFLRNKYLCKNSFSSINTETNSLYTHLCSFFFFFWFIWFLNICTKLCSVIFFTKHLSYFTWVYLVCDM